MNRPPGPHSARLALIPRPNRVNEGGIQSDLLAVRLDVPRACGYRRLLVGAVVARALGRASCRPGRRPSGQPAAFDEDVQKSLQAGLNAHLSKPVDPEGLFSTLESFIGK